ncbi:hypothetical protein CONPUDRAFT_80392 [Coniophora puteana RWD-64-598 SS2]|uniref:Uncharacterized protein n=1 Tax=Coniophora puteana (strain RWD-64-598) TaxID=741705 RepID=A0A5M3MXU0_CONPW|nr:uncharacterized protein CONPUDRAFT_80392 [Coniophora puteana RWD-64-598 SS2]EIW83846.1 hypothetical protein CONPUDRAFT_80392 [Coniophora puteana RWD-64-598 SS2]
MPKTPPLPRHKPSRPAPPPARARVALIRRLLRHPHARRRAQAPCARRTVVRANPDPRMRMARRDLLRRREPVSVPVQRLRSRPWCSGRG